MIPKDRFFQRGGSTIRYSSNGELLFLFRCTMPFYAFFLKQPADFGQLNQLNIPSLLGGLSMTSPNPNQLSWRQSWKSPFLPSTGADRVGHRFCKEIHIGTKTLSFTVFGWEKNVGARSFWEGWNSHEMTELQSGKALLFAIRLWWCACMNWRKVR